MNKDTFNSLRMQVRSLESVIDLKDKGIKKLEHRVEVQQKVHERQGELCVQIERLQTRVQEYETKFRPFIDELKRTGTLSVLSQVKDVIRLQKQVQSLTQANEMLMAGASSKSMDLAMSVHKRLVLERDSCTGCDELCKKLDAASVEMDALKQELAVQTELATIKKASFSGQLSFVPDTEKLKAINDGLCVCSSTAVHVQTELAKRTAEVKVLKAAELVMRQRINFLGAVITSAAGGNDVEKFVQSLGIGKNDMQCCVCETMEQRVAACETKAKTAEQAAAKAIRQCKDFEQRWRCVVMENGALKAEMEKMNVKAGL